MKKLFMILLVLIVSLSVYGQKEVDNILKARALNESGRTEDAKKLLSDAIRLENNSRYYLERAEVNFSSADYSDAISDYNEANKLSPLSGEYGLSRIYAVKGDVKTTLYHLELSMGSKFKRSEKVILLDPAFRNVEGKMEWRQFWKKEWYTPLEQSSSQIEYLVSAGKTDQAQEIFRDISSRYPDNNEVLYLEAFLNFSFGKYNDVIRSVTLLLNTDQGNEKYLRLLAKAQIEISNPSAASNTYTAILNSGIDDAKLLLLRANCYKQTGENNRALRDIEKYLDYYPEDKAALSLAGKVEAIAGDNLKALSYFSRNLDLHPNDAECYIDRANSYLISRSWNWAIRDYSMALDLNPENSDACLNMGVALLNSSKTEDACHYFRMALKLGNKRATDYISRNCIR